MHFIDLHVHLDGSIPLTTARELAARQGLPSMTRQSCAAAWWLRPTAGT